MKLLSVIIFSITFVLYGFSQDIDYARSVIQQLSGKSFMGRGYCHNGIGDAATYIKNELRSHNAAPIKDAYSQPFFVNVNCLKPPISVVVNHVTLTNTTDYSIDGSSGAINGCYPVTLLNYKNVNDISELDSILINLNQNSFLCIDTQSTNNEIRRELIKIIDNKDKLPCKGIIVFTDYLYQTISGNAPSLPMIKLHNKFRIMPFDSICVQMNNQFLENYETENICAHFPGKTDSTIVFTAHYDHLGMIGDSIYFPGANDNASGVAMLLNLVKYFGIHPHRYNIAFIFFSAEELGLKGSFYYANNPLFPLSKIKFLFNLDLVGTGDEGIKIVNGSVYKKEFDLLQKINSNNNLLPAVKARGTSANSDHFPFYQKGVPSFFIYTLCGIAAYHNPLDRSETLPLTGYNELFKLLTEFVNTYE